MKVIEGNIIDPKQKRIIKGRLFYNKNIISILADDKVNSSNYIMPGFVDAHLHIESTLLTPLEYSKIAVKHGVVAVVADPHEIANVAGIEGVRYMINNAKDTPMKIYFGAPSCVPATNFETSGSIMNHDDIEILFKNKECSHLSEMMNFPGVICRDNEVLKKIEIAKKYGKPIDGHCPKLTGNYLIEYINAGIQTDHESTTIEEATEKIEKGLKIQIRKSTASNDFKKLKKLIIEYDGKVMLCCDDIYPYALKKGYINVMVKEIINENYDIFSVINAYSKTAIDHYKLDVGMMQEGDPADFIVVNNLKELKIIKTIIDGDSVYESGKVNIRTKPSEIINHFFVNKIVPLDIKVEKSCKKMHVIEVLENSLLTKKKTIYTNAITKNSIIQSNIKMDVLKMVILNRYTPAKAQVGFVKGFKLFAGALASSVAHDSHNIVAVGTTDEEIIEAIEIIQERKGGFAAIAFNKKCLLPLPIGGLMSNKSCDAVSAKYIELKNFSHQMGCKLDDPFISLSFLALLVIPSLKLGDKGLFDVDQFKFIDLQE